MVGALRKLGADYVVDTNFGADLTIMEEASELVERLKKWRSNSSVYKLLPSVGSLRKSISLN